MTDKTVIAVRIAPLQGGQHMKGAKVVLAWDGKTKTSIVGSMFAAFPGDMRGQQVEVSVNGQPVGTVFVPISTPTGVATIPIETAAPETPVAQLEEPDQQQPEEVQGNGRGRGKRAGFFRRHQPGSEEPEEPIEDFKGEDFEEEAPTAPKPRQPVPLGNIVQTHGHRYVNWVLLAVIVLVVGLGLWRASVVPKDAKGLVVGFNIALQIILTLAMFIAGGFDAAGRRQIKDFLFMLLAFAINWAGGTFFKDKADLCVLAAVASLAFPAFFGGRDMTQTAIFIIANAVLQPYVHWGAIGILTNGVLDSTTVVIGAIAIAIAIQSLDTFFPEEGKWRWPTLAISILSLLLITFFLWLRTGWQPLSSVPENVWMPIAIGVGLLLNFMFATGESYRMSDPGAADTNIPGIRRLQRAFDRAMRETQYDSVIYTTALISIWLILGLPFTWTSVGIMVGVITLLLIIGGVNNRKKRFPAAAVHE